MLKYCKVEKRTDKYKISCAGRVFRRDDEKRI